MSVGFNFNPHLYVLAADGVFGAGGMFIALSAVPEALLAEGIRGTRCLSS